ncbi:ABC transporter ATP-binding protein [Patescibacteria group bacterium]|nr:ABC transporter ATP-binding protein [Patescibacteria group bacterium]
MDYAISAEHLEKSYGGQRAVDGLTLHVKKGEFFGFLGPNGAGKTTTIRMITGILRPDHGAITIDGNPSSNRRVVTNIIGVVPESRGFYDWMTAEEYLGFFADLYGIKGEEKAKRLEALLLEVGLTKRKDSRIGTYSRGMRQRLGLARALVNNPRILFLDEPTLGLDPQGQEDVQLLLKGLNASGVTIFFSSHLLNEVSNLCSRIGIINYGKLIAEGTISELRERTKLQDKTLTDIFLHLTRNDS